MNEKIRLLLGEIARLEEELSALIQDQQEQLHYRIEGSKVRFEKHLRRIHRELKTGVFAWLRESELRNVVSAPFIYAMIIPFVLLDIFITVYQAVCFPLYRIPRVRRSNYIVIDRHNLGYLNVFEKLNCAYCGYADGLLAYTRQVLSRTELYWCPVKHARKVLDPHRQYARFADFGDGEGYAAHAAALRNELSQES
ncbi:MAG: hypothetical protein OEM63_05540 [Gammaproteobacteria bacterium]|nr:hypothetical protein [Gammaproteobacteria bacterium]